MNIKRKLVMILAVATTQIGCTSWMQIRVDQLPQLDGLRRGVPARTVLTARGESVTVDGSSVIAVRTAGRSYVDFERISVDHDRFDGSLGGTRLNLALGEIQAVSVQRTDWTLTALAAIGVTVAILVTVIGAAYLLICPGGHCGSWSGFGGV